MSVGRSKGKTPAKHEMMCSLAGREIGVANSLPQIDRLVWLDLTAGDGIPDEGQTWRRGCSPGIHAYHPLHSAKATTVRSYERDSAAFGRLLSNLDEEMPALGYERSGGLWVAKGLVSYRPIFGSGHDANLDDIDSRTAVFVSNDPNKIYDWAMRPTFAAEVVSRTPWFRSICTMGCNVGGSKRMTREEREAWYRHLDTQESMLPRHRDLLLAAIDGDGSRWAYLLNEPAKWRGTQERVVASAFAKYGYAMRMAWYRTDRAEYEAIKDYLFLTTKEREAV